MATVDQKEFEEYLKGLGVIRETNIPKKVIVIEDDEVVEEPPLKKEIKIIATEP